jgi:hypothetical protein
VITCSTRRNNSAQNKDFDDLGTTPNGPLCDGKRKSRDLLPEKENSSNGVADDGSRTPFQPETAA